MEASRVFVKNLPPTLTEADFRRHFSSNGKGQEITDVKLISKRRIGYIGYKSPQDAAKAVKYFNRSYIRLSRISVEPAKTISDPSLPNARRARYDDVGVPTQALEPKREEATSDQQPKKRKREDLDESDKKLKEYLEVMKTGQVSSNKLEGIMDPGQPDVGKEEPALQIEAESDDEYETIPTRPAKKPREATEGREAEPATQDLRVADVVKGQDPPTLPEASRPTADVNATDDDWLRSRTNRLLDLVDPDDPEVAVKQQSSQVVPKQGSQDIPADGSPVSPGVVDQDVVEDHEEQPAHHVDQDSAVDTIRGTARLFLRNLPYSATEEDLRSHFETFGEVKEGQLIPIGRLLHILPAAPKKELAVDEFAISKLPLKKQNLIKKRAEAASTTFNWNSLYMSQDAVVASTAARLGVSKSDLLDPTSADAAVKQAIAETSVIQETKAYFAAHGVDLDAFKSQKKGDTAILVKNFPFGTTIDELRKLFEEHGTVLQVLMPPSKTIAIVQFSQPAHAKAAFAKLAYRRVKDSVLFLEKAPRKLFGDQKPPQPQAQVSDDRPAQKVSVAELLERDDNYDQLDTTSLFVRNLAFATTTEQLAETFKSLDGFVAARVKTKKDPKRPGQILSMGFGFVEFKTKDQALAALKVMDGYDLEGHTLVVKASHKGLDAAEERRREDNAKKAAGQRTKIVIKNLPFQASKKDVRTLFGTYGQLRAVRVPKKFGNSSRGFAFAEFVTPREAENALNALKDTHLLGRRLVLDYAEAEAIDPEEEIEKMQKKIGGQANKMALQQLTGRGRQKVNIGDSNEDEV
ncbi:putative pre-rrna processing protein [Phaeoacremonium minimum UCRPA7]|uniref:Multiple RNA-binding domain-containing protein 1 n=1 Tax=Phaeoacremonium minimum (strain UCR-PA7) TaxID=1286976 RepID=R8BGU3_PHAM7|nr:putative pre-rrna processing protein [Phaeoacremonium minimum UCRPA7]EON98528.1 putative pre-rrna processing protein [Phaeoacremonium minimum UCRPA7]